MSGTLNPYRHQYETVAASQTQQVLGNTGAAGDFLHRIIINVSSTSTAGLIIYDGATVILSVNASVMPLGLYSIEFNVASQNGAWKVTTGSGVSVIGIGTFTN